jgi:hypothetical protein
MKAEHEKLGPEPSNARYGYVVPTGPIDHTRVCVSFNIVVRSVEPQER